jgi:transposase-like protein
MGFYPVSVLHSLSDFIDQQAYEQLAEFETISKANLVASPCLHVDETGININGKRHWLHGTSNDKWTHFYIVLSIARLFYAVVCHLPG